jgi:hypothetical protein
MAHLPRFLGHPVWLCSLIVGGVIYWTRPAPSPVRMDPGLVARHEAQCNICLMDRSGLGPTAPHPESGGAASLSFSTSR